MFIATLLVAGLLLGTDAPTQRLHAVQLDGSANLYFDAYGKVNACGLRILGVEPVPGLASRLQSVDVSLLVPDETLAKGVGLIKAASVEAWPSGESAAGRTVKVREGWIRAAGHDRTAPFEGRLVDSDDSPDAVLYLSELDSIMGVVRAALSGSEIRLSVKRDGQSQHPIYVGRVLISDADRRQLDACFAELLRQAAVER